MIGRRPDSTLYKRKIVIGTLSASMINKHIARYFQACECTISSLRTKSVRLAVFKIENHAHRSHKTTSREDIDIVTSFRCTRFLSRARIPGLIRNAKRTRICSKPVQRRLNGCPCVSVPLPVHINV